MISDKEVIASHIFVGVVYFARHKPNGDFLTF